MNVAAAVTTHRDTPHAAHATGSDRLLLVLLLGASLPLLDTTMVTVAVERLSSVFHAPVSSVDWVTTAYALAAAVAIPLAGWAGARFGHRRLWLASLTAFLAGSVGCSLAWNVPSLVAFRGLQGAGGGLSMPVLQTILIEAVGTAGARRAMGRLGTCAVLAPVLGPIVGAGLLSAGSWRMIFWINVPICLVAIVLGARVIAPGRSDPDVPSFDRKGFLLLAPGLAAVVYALASVSGAGRSLSPWAIMSFAAGATAIVLFVRHWVRRGREGLLALDLFRYPPFRWVSVSLFLSGAVFFGSITFLPLWFQVQRDDSILVAGLAAAIQGVGAMASRYLIARIDVATRTLVLAGWLLTAAGTVPFALPATTGADWLLALALVARGAGLGVVTVTLLGVAYAGLQKTQVKHASVLVRLSTQLGGAVGVATLSIAVSYGAAAGSAGTSQLGWTLCFLLICVMVLAALVPAAKLRPQTEAPTH